MNDTLRKICVVTGSRAEYGLLYWFMRTIEDHSALQLQLIVTGMHLSPEFGLTYKKIEEDGFTIDAKVEMLLSSDSSVGVTKAMGLGLIGLADAYENLKPDFVVLLGDRFEILSAAIAAVVARIPIAHIHGGETTEGACDEAIRHSITKMSYLHFTSTEAYRMRVIQLGESPERVFNVGAPGLDNINNLKMLSRSELEAELNITLHAKTLLITYHPVTLENDTAISQFQELLNALDSFSDICLIFTMANADAGGRLINAAIQAYVESNKHKAACFTSLGSLRYLSLLACVDGVVGNSSSGIIEVPAFSIGTVNIGDRQAGRVRAPSVIDCLPTKIEIKKAIAKLYSNDFKSILQHGFENPYGRSGASNQIAKILAEQPVQVDLKKKFYDLDRTV